MVPLYELPVVILILQTYALAKELQGSYCKLSSQNLHISRRARNRT